jgi:WD40 repeat protein/predicted Ser/Thr protein kinase
MDANRNCERCGQPLSEAMVENTCAACVAALAQVDWLGEPTHPVREVPPAAHALPSVPCGTRLQYFGDYELLKEIARGGMGVVYKARQVSLNRPVALKLISAGALATPEAVKRFHTEAETAASLTHPNIVPIHEIGQYERQQYFSMGLVEGPNLRQRLSGAPMASREAATLVATLARAVHYAHQRGVLHRDIKPGNIVLGPEGRAHLTDFGLAKLIEKASTLTRTDDVMGTPSYMAPEQARGKAKEVTTAADIYGLGAVLYEALTGRPPFAGGTPVETLRQVMEQEPRRPSMWNAEVDRDVETICLKSLEKEPERRYSSAAALADDLDRWASGQAILARPVTSLERMVKWARRNPAVAGLLVTVHLVASCGLAGILWQWREAVVARRATQEQLWQSQLLEARSFRLDMRSGRRASALAVLKTAASYRPSLPQRNEALANLVLPDIGSNVWWRSTAAWPHSFSSDLDYIAHQKPGGEIVVLHRSDREPMVQFPGLSGGYKLIRFSPDDSLLAVIFQNGKARVWNWRDKKLVLDFTNRPEKFSFVEMEFTPDGSEIWFSDSRRGLVRFSLPDGRLLPPPALGAKGGRVRFDPKGQRLAALSGRDLTIWDVATGAELGKWEAPGDIRSVAWHPSTDGVALGTYQAGIHFAEIGQDDLVPFHSEASLGTVFTHVSFTPDGEFLLAGGWGNFIAAWRFATRQLEMRVSNFWFHQLSRDGSRVAGVTERVGFGVQELLLPVGIRQFRVPAGLGASVEAAAWHPDGRWLVTVHTSGWAVWDTARGILVKWREQAHTRSVDFFPDGKAFLTGGGAGAQLWSFQEQNGVPHIELVRTLTPDPAIPYERAALSHDGRRFAAVGKSHAWLGSIDGDLPPIRIRGGTPAHFVGFTHDDRWLCLSRFGGSKVSIRDAFTGAMVTNLPTGTYGFQISPSGEHLLATKYHAVGVWQIGSWERVREAPFGSEWPGSSWLGSLPPSCGFTIGEDGGLQIRDLKTNAEVATLWLPSGSKAWGPVLDPSGRRLAAFHGQPRINLWDLEALRRELARLGLDWRDDDPAHGFAPQR